MSTVIHSIWSWMGRGSRGGQGDHPSDAVMPLHDLDASRELRQLIMQRTFRFHALLDADMLRDSWAELLEMGHWRKLGGRLRLNATTRRLELRIPTPFTEARPGVLFTQASYDCAIDEHPVGATLKPPGDRAEVFPITAERLQQLRGPKAPSALDEYLARDVPLWSCHVITFADATLVTVTWPHVIDGPAAVDVLVNWSRVLAGAPQDVLPLADPYADAVALVADSGPGEPEEALIPERKRLSGFRLFLWVARMVIGKLLSPRPAGQYKGLFIPLRHIPRMQDQSPGVTDTAQTVAVFGQQFLGPNDVLMAWLIRTICRKETGSPARSITLLGALNARDRLPPGRVYMQNLCLLTSTFLTLGQAVAQPLCDLAAAVRESIRKQTAPAQASGNARQLLRHLVASGSIPLYGETDSLLINVSNIAQVDMSKAVDFGAAVVSADYDNLDPGRPVSHLGAATDQTAHVNAAVISRQGTDYWVEACLPGDVWNDLETQIEAWNRAEK